MFCCSRDTLHVHPYRSGIPQWRNSRGRVTDWRAIRRRFRAVGVVDEFSKPCCAARIRIATAADVFFSPSSYSPLAPYDTVFTDTYARAEAQRRTKHSPPEPCYSDSPASKVTTFFFCLSVLTEARRMQALLQICIRGPRPW